MRAGVWQLMLVAGVCQRDESLGEHSPRFGGSTDDEDRVFAGDCANDLRPPLGIDGLRDGLRAAWKGV
jgi:hypothetical protein